MDTNLLHWKYISYFDLVHDIKKNLHKVHYGNYDLIVGVPRSGMVPAYMIALYLNLHITDLNGFINNLPLEKGQRKLKRTLNKPHDAKKVLLVDDTIATGYQMEANLQKLSPKLKEVTTTCVVYASNPDQNVDIYLKLNGVRRLFEWNLFHRDILNKACVDIDGVLCTDPSLEQDDDGDKYMDFILNAKPLMIPSYKIHSLVTSRLERYRSQTEAWLRQWNIEYDNLIMLNLQNKIDRYKNGDKALDHKANYFSSLTDLEIFIESDMDVSLYVMKKTGKPVLCIDENILISPNTLNRIKNNPGNFYRIIRPIFIRIIPNPLKAFLKQLIKKFKIS